MVNILDLNDDCMLEIIKYIIAACELREESPDNPSKYADIENFAKVDKNIKELLRIHHKEILYHRELTEVATTSVLTIDFAQLQAAIANKNEGEAYWKLYTKAIGRNNLIRAAKLFYDPTSDYPEFPTHFQMIKCALENKMQLWFLKLALKGYSVDDLDLNNFGNLTDLYLDVRISAEALVSVCQSAPRLNNLKFMSTEINGRLSDIVPHCRNLMFLTFVPKPDVDGSEYAPLVELPRLREITIHGAYKNGSLLTMFEAIKSWQRAETYPLIVNFTDELPPMSNVTMAGMNSVDSLSHSLEHSPDRIKLGTSYDFFEISRDSRPLEQSLATITLIAASFKIHWLWKRVTLQRCRKSDISGLIPLLKSFNIKGLTIYMDDENKDEETSMPKLFGSMIQDGEFFLKSICINRTEIDRFGTLQLVRLKSITFLECSFSDWESIDLLNELTNLHTLNISVEKEFEKSSSKALCNLLNTCKVFASIRCHHWIIEFKKIDTILSPSNGTNTLTIKDGFERGSLNELFEALANRTFNANEELDISSLDNVDFKDILKVAEIHTLKKLSIRLSDTNGIEKFFEFTELEELTIWNDWGLSLRKLIIQLAAMKSPTLRVLKHKSSSLSPEDIFNVSKIKSIRNLELGFFDDYNGASVTELANSNIEELTITGVHFSQHKLLAAFAAKPSTKLHHLQIENKILDVVELSELSKLKDLRSLHCCLMDSKLSFLRDLKHIESLTLSLHNVDGLDVLADMKSLKELIIKYANASLSRVYQAFASKSDLKLEHLSVPIKCVEELQEITRIKRLKKLHLFVKTQVESVSDLGQLTELESLHIEAIKAREIESVLPILESCKNIECFSIKCTFDYYKNIVRKVHTLLKSIRNPAFQRPLILTVILNTFSESDFYLLEYLDDAYLKVFYSFNNEHLYKKLCKSYLQYIKRMDNIN